MTTKMPQRPKTTLGIAASISISVRKAIATCGRQEILREEDRDGDADEAADQQGEKRAVERAPDLRQDAEGMPLHVPAGVDEKGGPVPADGRQRLAADFPYDIDDQRNDREGACGGGQKECAIDRYAAAEGGCDADLVSDKTNETTDDLLRVSAPLRALANDARWRGDGLLNLGRGCFYLFDDFGRQRDIAHAIGDLLTVRQAVLDELPKKFSLLAGPASGKKAAR